MTGRVLARMKAMFLAAVFLGGGIGLPEYDALAYHLGSTSQEIKQPHFDPLGGCRSHGDHCALGSVGAAPRYVPTRPGAVVLVPSADSPSLRPQSIAQLPFFFQTVCRPRAPPLQSS